MPQLHWRHSRLAARDRDRHQPNLFWALPMRPSTCRHGLSGAVDPPEVGAASTDGLAALHGLGEKYRLFEAVTYHAAGVSSDSTKEALNVALTKSGNLKIEYFSQLYPTQPGRWDERPHYFVCYNEPTFFVGRNEGNTYLSRQEPDLWQQSPPFIHVILAPWPRLTEFAQAMGSDPACTFTFTNGVWQAKSVQQGVALAWSEDNRLLEFTRIAGENSTATTTFSGFYEKNGYSMPTAMRQEVRTGVIRDGREVGSDVAFTISDLSLDTGKAEAKSRFDAKAMRVNFYDEATHNVFDSDGQLLYNEVTAGGGSNGLFGISVPVILGLVVAICAVSAFLVLRRK
jgi:hypothetical protein